MTDIAAFLTACVDDDERGALAAGSTRSGKIASWRVACDCGATHADGCYECRVEGDNIIIYDEGGHDEDQARHIARHDPVRVLADVKVKRALLNEAAAMRDLAPAIEAWFLLDMATSIERALAVPYADRPGYKEGWRP